MQFFGITECPDEKCKLHSVLQIQQNEFWTRPEKKTIFRSDNVIVHLHYTGTTPVAVFWPHLLQDCTAKKEPSSSSTEIQQQVSQVDRNTYGIQISI